MTEIHSRHEISGGEVLKDTSMHQKTELMTVKLPSSAADFSFLNESCVVNKSVRRKAKTLNS